MNTKSHGIGEYVNRIKGEKGAFLQDFLLTVTMMSWDCTPELPNCNLSEAKVEVVDLGVLGQPDCWFKITNPEEIRKGVGCEEDGGICCALTRRGCIIHETSTGHYEPDLAKKQMLLQESTAVILVKRPDVPIPDPSDPNAAPMSEDYINSLIKYDGDGKQLSCNNMNYHAASSSKLLYTVTTLVNEEVTQVKTLLSGAAVVRHLNNDISQKQKDATLIHKHCKELREALNEQPDKTVPTEPKVLIRQETQFSTTLHLGVFTPEPEPKLNVPKRNFHTTAYDVPPHYWDEWDLGNETGCCADKDCSNCGRLESCNRCGQWVCGECIGVDLCLACPGMDDRPFDEPLPKIRRRNHQVCTSRR